MTFISGKYIEDIHFFEVNAKYISSNVLKISTISLVRSTISTISRVRSTSEIADIFSTFDEIVFVFTKKKIFFLSSPLREEIIFS